MESKQSHALCLPTTLWRLGTSFWNACCSFQNTFLPLPLDT
jgi:hypothetical protein